MPALPDFEIATQLTSLDGWTREGDEVVKTYELPSFMDAIAFVARVADLAEAADHHPDIDIRYRKVRIALSTHSEGGITQKDFDLAGAIEVMY
jgi:4a-hydroxytetrahydrobiopterin dehydratase